MMKIEVGELENGDVLQEPLQLLAGLLKRVDSVRFAGDRRMHAEVLHFKRDDGIDIFVVRGETRDKMRAQLPKEAQ